MRQQTVNGQHTDKASALLRQAAEFMGMCVGRLSESHQAEVARTLHTGARIRLVIEADADNILAGRVELAEADGVCMVVTNMDLTYTPPGANHG